MYLLIIFFLTVSSIVKLFGRYLGFYVSAILTTICIIFNFSFCILWSCFCVC